MQNKIYLCSEQSYYSSPGANIVLKFTVCGTLHNTKFHNALTELKRIHPLLNYTIGQDSDGKLFFIKTHENTPMVPELIKRNSKDDWISITKKFQKTPFNLKEQPGIKFIVLYDQEEFDIVLVGHHVMGDGLSLLSIVKDLIDVYCNDNMSLPIHKSKIVSSISDFPKESKLSDSELALIDKLNIEWSKNRKQYSQTDYEAMFNKFHNSLDSELLIASIKPEEFRLIKRRCKSHNATINTALLVSFIYSMKKTNQQVIFAIDNRKLFTFDPGRCMGNYASSIQCNLTYDHNKNFWENVQHTDKLIRPILHDTANRLRLQNIFTTINSDIYDGLYHAGDGALSLQSVYELAELLVPNKDPDAFTSSNLGNVNIVCNNDSYIVKDMAFIIPQNAAFSCNLGIVTLNDTCTLSLIHKKSVHSHFEMKQLVHDMVQVLTPL